MRPPLMKLETLINVEAEERNILPMEPRPQPPIAAPIAPPRPAGAVLPSDLALHGPQDAGARRPWKTPRDWKGIFIATGKQWSEHNILQMSAALAYYSIFSIAPLIVIIVAFAGYFYGPDAIHGKLEGQLSGMMGKTAATAVQSMVKSAYKPGQGIWAALIGTVTLLAGATGVFGQLKDALNKVFEAPPVAGSTVLALIRERVVSFGMILVIGFLMLASLVFTAVISSLWGWVAVWIRLPEFLLGVVGFVVSLSVTALLFALILKWLPDGRIRWRDAWVGAGLTAVLFELGKFLLGIYLGQESTASSYGAAGAVVLVLLWVYYTSAIVLTGAAFTAAYRKCKGERHKAKS
jgi:membrane protein